MRHLPGIMVAAAAGIVIAHLLFLVVGCASNPNGPGTHVGIELAADEAEQELCVANASTRMDADTCRAAVKAKYAVLLGDAGAEGGK